MAHKLVRHNLMTHASAIAFRLLVSLVPLVLLGLALQTAYLLVSSAIFLVGAELDEPSRRERSR